MHISLILPIVTDNGVGVVVGLIHGYAIQRLRHRAGKKGIVRILSLQHIAVVERPSIVRIDKVLPDALEACQPLQVDKLVGRGHHKGTATLVVRQYVARAGTALLDVGMGAEAVGIVVARRDGRHLLKEIMAGQAVVGRIEIGGVERHFVERQHGILQHIKHAVGHTLVVGTAYIEQTQPEAVGLVFHFARAVVVLQKVGHLLGLVVAILDAAGEHLHVVFAVVVHYLVADDVGQLCLVLHLCHQTRGDKYHALPSGKGVHRRAFDSVETQFATQTGVVLQQCVGDAFHHAGDRVAI